MRAGREPSGVRLVCVTKGIDVARIREAATLGISDFGENYVQEAKAKIEGFPEGPTWHMIGHLQSNKVKYVPPLFRYVHSVDRWELLESLDRYGREMQVLFELNLSGETSKHGCGEEGLRAMLSRTETLKQVKPVGLMTMGPLDSDPEVSRPVFRRLREIRDLMNREFGLNLRELSMGMSSDFEVAIEEGATMVRVGTAIFGERR
jgi:pyridoxal phosphate enzyme (YggS family)